MANTNMDTSSTPITRSGKDAPIELLPLEIKAIIIEHLCRPDALTLKFCSPTFYHAKVTLTKSLIPRYRFRDKPDLKCDDVFKKWIHRPLACATCRRLRPSYKFTDKMKHGDIVRRKREVITRDGDPKPKALQAISRFCVDCGTTPDARGYQQYGRGTWLRIGGLSHIVCVQCNRVDLSDKRKENLCRGCWETKIDAKPVALALRSLSLSMFDECRTQGSRTSHRTTSEDAGSTEAALGVSDPKPFLAQMTHVHVVQRDPAKTAKGTDVMRKVNTKKGRTERGESRKSKFGHSSRIEKNKPKPRSTADTTNLSNLQRIQGDWKPELPRWHNTTLLPLPATRVFIDSRNAVSSEAFMDNISSVHTVPTLANAALNDAQLWGKMMLQGRPVDQPYIKHRVGWNDGPRDVEMEDKIGEEQNSDEDGDLEIEDEDRTEEIKDEISVIEISDDDGGAESRDRIGEEEIEDEDSEEQSSDEEGGVKIPNEDAEADITNQIPEAERKDESREVDVADAGEKAKLQEAKTRRQQAHRREQAKRIRQRSLRWLSSAQLSKTVGLGKR